MKLDHISYAASHDQLIDVVQRLGSILGSPFIDGGLHPRFGTRNFILPLKNGHYLEVVCPIEHPAAELSPFGKVVSQRAAEGGGWLTWVVSTEEITPIEERLKRKSVIGSRKRPDGSELQWKQLGVLGTLSDAQLPFFIEWLTKSHPSTDGKPSVEITKLELCGSETIVENWLGADLTKTFDGIEIEWKNPKEHDDTSGILAVHFNTQNGLVRID